MANRSIAKRGQAITFGNAGMIVLAVILVIFVAATGAVGLTSFRQTECSSYWDGSTCWNNVSQNYEVASTVAYNSTGNGLTSLANFSLQMPTVGTMLGVGLILAVVIGVFAYFATKN